MLSNLWYRNFNLPNFVDAAFKELKSDVNLTAGVTIGKFPRDPHYTCILMISAQAITPLV